jgi:hypothetical protein
MIELRAGQIVNGVVVEIATSAYASISAKPRISLLARLPTSRSMDR